MHRWLLSQVCQFCKHLSSNEPASHCKAADVSCLVKTRCHRIHTGEMLALLGPLHPSAIAFHPHALARPLLGSQPAAEQLLAANGKRGKAAAAAQHAEPAEPWLGAALVQLHGFLTDADVAIISMAQNALRYIPLSGTSETSATTHRIPDTIR